MFVLLNETVMGPSQEATKEMPKTWSHVLLKCVSVKMFSWKRENEIFMLKLNVQ